MALKHVKTDHCINYLPKPRKRNEHLIAQCPWCKTYFVCRWDLGYYWEETNDN